MPPGQTCRNPETNHFAPRQTLQWRDTSETQPCHAGLSRRACSAISSEAESRTGSAAQVSRQALALLHPDLCGYQRGIRSFIFCGNSRNRARIVSTPADGGIAGRNANQHSCARFSCMVIPQVRTDGPHQDQQQVEVEGFLVLLYSAARATSNRG